MPIWIRQGAEPYSRRAREGAGDALGLIESSAYRLLRTEARRYIEGSTRGRSFLVAGHRGSGKTTLVLQVCQELTQRPSSTHYRPLLVLLHGPNLLPPPKAAPKKENQKKEENGEDPEAAASATAVSEDEAQNALIQITLGLYRALSQALANRYRERILPKPWEPQSSPRLQERLELAAQLELELDRCPEPARLREFWERGGFLPEGVLRPESHGSYGPGSPFGSDGPPRLPPDQGYRELLALSSACEMYRRISATLTHEQESKGEAQSEQKAEATTGSGDKDFLTPLAVLLTGGLVGTGAFAADVSGPWSAFTGLLASLGAATSFKITSSKSRKRTYEEETKVVWDFSVDTLDRELPVLIDRARKAGLVPLFVVDELDKIEGFSKRITSLVRRLKKLVAERAFFCFLTDRAYFEEMRRRTIEQAYPIEYTYFTHRLFIVFDPLDFHRYLGDVLEEPGAGGPPVKHDSASTEKEVPSSSALSEEKADLQVLPYVVLHQAKMHAIDLQRRLIDLREEGGSLRLAPGALRTRANLCDLVIQVAVEIVLDQEEVRKVLRRDPPFRRLLYDALYYPSRRWEQAEYKIDLKSESAFGDWLIERMGSQETDEEGHVEPIRIPPADLTFLVEQTRHLCELLCDKKSFEHGFASWEKRRTKQFQSPADRKLLDRALAWPSMEELLAHVYPLLDSEETHLYRWRIDRAGLRRAREGVQSDEVGLAHELEEQRMELDVVEQVRGMASFLAVISQ